jgi:hypothetical protein
MRTDGKSNFMKIRPVGAEMFHAGGRTDITKLVLAFRNSSTRQKTNPIFYDQPYRDQTTEPLSHAEFSTFLAYSPILRKSDYIPYGLCACSLSRLSQLTESHVCDSHDSQLHFALVNFMHSVTVLCIQLQSDGG